MPRKSKQRPARNDKSGSAFDQSVSLLIPLYVPEGGSISASAALQYIYAWNRLAYLVPTSETIVDRSVKNIVRFSAVFLQIFTVVFRTARYTVFNIKIYEEEEHEYIKNINREGLHTLGSTCTCNLMYFLLSGGHHAIELYVRMGRIHRLYTEGKCQSLPILQQVAEYSYSGLGCK